MPILSKAYMKDDLQGPSYLGRHFLMELYDCDPNLLSSSEQTEQILVRAAHLMGATVVGAHFHLFSPQGVSGVVIIQESHLSIHTWPEHRYAAIDVFTCGDIQVEVGIDHLTTAFAAGHTEVRQFKRGKAHP